MDTAKQVEPAAEVDPRYPNTPIGIVRSRDAFLRDLPALLANPKYDRWSVAYCGDERIALSKSLEEVARICRERGLTGDQCYIGCVFPHANEDEEEVDTGFYELEEFEEEMPTPPDAGKPTP